MRLRRVTKIAAPPGSSAIVLQRGLDSEGVAVKLKIDLDGEIASSLRICSRQVLHVAPGEHELFAHFGIESSPHIRVLLEEGEAILIRVKASIFRTFWKPGLETFVLEAVKRW